MRLKLGRIAVTCALVAAMATMALPAQALAESDAGDYLGEVAVAYGDSGADDLEAAGYEVVESDGGGAADVNAGNGTATYIGYKSTDDPSQAITDLAVMGMKGGYSISAWKDELESATNTATTKAYELGPVIKELRANYKEGTNDTTGVIDLLNTYTEDDSGLGMGDFLLDTGKCTEGTLANVMLQSNPDNFLAVEYLLSKAVATNWTAKVPNLDTDKSYDVDDDVLQALVDQVLGLHDNLAAYQESKIKVDDVEDATEDASTESEGVAIADVTKYGSIYEALDKIDYGNSGKTLLDLFLTAKKYLTTEDVAPLASLLTEGQVAIMPVVGIDTLVLDSVSMDTEAQSTAISEAQELVDGVEAVSMYEGVNRDIFTKDNVALTSDAIRQQSMTGDTSMFFNNSNSDSLYGAAVVFAVLSVDAYMLAVCRTSVYNKIKAIADYYSTGSETASESEVIEGAAMGYYDQQANIAKAAVTRAKVLCGVLAAVACIAAGVGIALDLYNYYHPKRYTIPDIIVDQVDYTDSKGDADSYYVDYEVARLLDGSAADMNGGSGTWNCLYYTTNKKAGDPVTVDELVASANATMTGADNKSLPVVHAFGETAALNLNGGDSASYLFFARDAEAFSGSDATASAFGAGYLALAAGIALVVGLAGGFAIGRRKKGAAA